ncbi:MAG: thermonuclease family protein [Frankiaceae bacterium]
MPLTLIKGSYRVVGTQPDGDSVRFYPTDVDAFHKTKIAAQQNAQGGVQLRLDAIDALETHYTPRVAGGHHQHQPLGLAHEAADELLRLLGFTGVQRADNETLTAATPDRTDGYILTKFADKYGRPVSLAYPGTAAEDDLADVFLDIARLRESVNHQLTAAGLVYPTFYSQFFPDLRGALTEAADEARSKGSGVWAQDTTTTGTQVTVTSLSDTAVILPKLFRRLADYLALNDGSTSLAGFKEFLAARDDRVLILTAGHFTGFDFVVDVDGDTVRLASPPEDLVFVEG